jgi:hypothetical protein
VAAQAGLHRFYFKLPERRQPLFVRHNVNFIQSLQALTGKRSENIIENLVNS